MKKLITYIWAPIAIIILIMMLPFAYALTATSNISGSLDVDTGGCHWTPSTAPGVSTSSLTVPDNEYCYITQSMQAATVTVAADGDAVAPYGGTLVVGSDANNVFFTVYDLIDDQGTITVGYGTTHNWDAVLSTNTANLNITNGGSITAISNTTIVPDAANNYLTIDGNLNVGSVTTSGTLTLSDTSGTSTVSSTLYAYSNSQIALNAPLSPYYAYFYDSSDTTNSNTFTVNQVYMGNSAGDDATFTNTGTFDLDSAMGINDLYLYYSTTFTNNGGTLLVYDDIFLGFSSGVTAEQIAILNNNSSGVITNTAGADSYIMMDRNAKFNNNSGTVTTDRINMIGRGANLSTERPILTNYASITTQTVYLDYPSSAYGGIINNETGGSISVTAAGGAVYVYNGGQINNKASATFYVTTGSIGTSDVADPGLKGRDATTGKSIITNASTHANCNLATPTANCFRVQTSVFAHDYSDITNTGTFRIDNLTATVNYLSLRGTSTFTNTSPGILTVDGAASDGDGITNIYDTASLSNTGTINFWTLNIGKHTATVIDGGSLTNSGTTGMINVYSNSTAVGTPAIDLYQGAITNSSTYVGTYGSFNINGYLYMLGTLGNSSLFTNTGAVYNVSNTYIYEYSALILNSGSVSRWVSTTGTNNVFGLSGAQGTINIASGAVYSCISTNFGNDPTYSYGLLSNSGDIKRIDITGALLPADASLTFYRNSTFNNNSTGYVRTRNGTITINNPTTFSNAGNINYTGGVGTNEGTIYIYTSNAVTNTGIIYATTLDIGSTVGVYGVTFNNNGTVNTSSGSIKGTYNNAATKTSTYGTANINSVSAYLNGGTSPTTTISLWTPVADGSFRITIDGTQKDITGINFAGVTTMAEVASKIQTAIRAATGSIETCTWSSPRFIISSANATMSSAITVTSAVSPATGTDISGAGATAFMDAETSSGTVTVRMDPGILNNYGSFIGTNLYLGISSCSTGLICGGLVNNDGTTLTFTGSTNIYIGGILTNYVTRAAPLSTLTLNTGAKVENNGTMTCANNLYLGNTSTHNTILFNNNATGTLSVNYFAVWGSPTTDIFNNYGAVTGTGPLYDGYLDAYTGGIVNNYGSFARGGGNTVHNGATFNNYANATTNFGGTTQVGYTSGAIATYNQVAGTPGTTKSVFSALTVYGYGTFNNNDKITTADWLSIYGSAGRLGQFNGNSGSTTQVGTSVTMQGLWTIASGATASAGTTITELQSGTSLIPTLTIDGTLSTAQSISVGANSKLLSGNTSSITLTASPSIQMAGATPFAELAGAVSAHSIHSTGSVLSNGYMCIGDYTGTYPTGACTHVGASAVSLTGSNANSIYVLTTSNTSTIEIANDVTMAGGIQVSKGVVGTTSKVNVAKDAVITINGRNADACYGVSSCAIDVGTYNTAAGAAEMNVYGRINLSTATGRLLGLGNSTSNSGTGTLSIKSDATLGNGYINDNTNTQLNVARYLGKLNIERTDATNYGRLYLGGTCTINSPGASTDHNRGANIDGTMRCYTSLTVAATGSVDQSYVDTLAYNSQGGTNFTIGETITGGTSGATAKILVDTDAGATGTLTIYSLTKNFASAETITGSSSGATATTTSVNAYADRSVVTVDGSDTTVNGMYYLDGLLNSGNLTVNSGGHVTSSAGTTTNFYINADNLTVNSGGYIDSDEVSTVDRTGAGTGGGSYAGHGLDSGGTPVATYGTTKATSPTYGMRGENAGASSANGGGGVNIFADGNITINGEVSANGATAAGSGGGSGGTVIITHTPTATGAFFSGTGTITALGGDGTYPGGGGRIVIDSKLLDDPDFGTYDFGEATAGTIKAFGGANGTTSYAAAGTIVYTGDTNNPDDTLIIDQNNKALAGSYITDIADTDSFDRVELRNTAKADLSGISTTGLVCYLLSSSTESGSSICSSTNSLPDKPDTLYINNSVIKAGSGTEPGYTAGKGNGVLSTAQAVGDLTPVFSAIYKNPSSTTKPAVNINIQVDNNSTFASPEWNYSGAILNRSGASLVPGVSGNRSADVEYAGTAIVPGDTYYVRVRFTDADDTGLWSHADYNDQYKFVINNYFDIYPICAGNTFAIKDANNPTDNIKNQNGKRFGKGTCTMGVLSGNFGAWQIKFGMTEAEGTDAAVAFGDGTNDIDPINNATTCDLDESGNTATEAYGFNIAGSTVGTPVSDAPPCTGTTFATADKYHNVELYSAIQKIITGTGTMLTEQTFPLNIFVNVDAGTIVSSGYNLGMAFIMTTNP